jgi:hypothetical protein
MNHSPLARFIKHGASLVMLHLKYTISLELAGALGIEPTLAVLEAAVLPLNDTPVGIGGR